MKASSLPCAHAAGELLTVAEADAEIARCMSRLPIESVPLDAAAGRILREEIRADRDQPAFDRVTMDGIAFAWQDRERPALAVAGIQAAGRPPLTRTLRGQCFEVMTGAVLPHGCDCVVPIEQVLVRDERAIISSGAEPQRMQYVHRRESDYARGARLLEAGLRLRGPELAVLASAGRMQVQVASEPSVAIIVTGDELVDVDRAPEPHQLRQSNDRAIAAALRLRGYTHIARTRVADDPARLRSVIGERLASHDVLVLSGGVSMGRFDHVPAALQDAGVAARFHRLRQRPGKPMWFGVGGAGQAVFALPGNPVSALVCVHRYVLPALELAAGARPSSRLTIRLARPVQFEPELTWFLPVRIDGARGHARAEPALTNTSGDFAALAGTDGFVELAAGRQRFPAGYSAPFYGWQGS